MGRDTKVNQVQSDALGEDFRKQQIERCPSEKQAASRLEPSDRSKSAPRKAILESGARDEQAGPSTSKQSESEARPVERTGPMTSSLQQFRNLLRGGLHAKITEDHIQSLLSVRRGREALFGRHLFSDPAWDILLELYAAKLGNRAVSSDELGSAVGVANSLIERWLRALVEAGLVEQIEAGDETAFATVALSEIGAAKMAQLVDQWGSAFLTI